MKYITESPEWVTFYPEFNSGFYVSKAGYFDERPEVHTSITQLVILVALPFLLFQSPLFLFLVPFLIFGWGTLYIHLPIKTGIQDCDSAAWGINYHSNQIWIYVGGAGNYQGGRKWKTITMFWDLTWVRTTTLMKDGSCFNETPQNRKSYSKDEEGVIIGSYDWLEANKLKDTYPYVDTSDNSVVNATVSVQEREWRPLWFKWTKLFSKKRTTIEVEFDKEVGGRKGSWKGGCVACSYEMKAGETPLQCLKRMESERVFR